MGETVRHAVDRIDHPLHVLGWKQCVAGQRIWARRIVGCTAMRAPTSSATGIIAFGRRQNSHAAQLYRYPYSVQDAGGMVERVALFRARQTQR